QHDDPLNGAAASRQACVGEGGVEPPRPYGHTDLNRARLPFRHSPQRRPEGSTQALIASGPSPPTERPRLDSRGTDTIGPAVRGGSPLGVLQRFERRLEGLVGTAFARLFKGQVEPVEVA